MTPQLDCNLKATCIYMHSFMQTTTSLVFNSDSINSDSFNCCFYQEMQHVRATVQSDCTKELYSGTSTRETSTEGQHHHKIKTMKK